MTSRISLTPIKQFVQLPFNSAQPLWKRTAATAALALAAYAIYYAFDRLFSNKVAPSKAGFDSEKVKAWCKNRSNVDKYGRSGVLAVALTRQNVKTIPPKNMGNLQPKDGNIPYFAAVFDKTKKAFEDVNKYNDNKFIELAYTAMDAAFTLALFCILEDKEKYKRVISESIQFYHVVRTGYTLDRNFDRKFSEKFYLGIREDLNAYEMRSLYNLLIAECPDLGQPDESIDTYTVSLPFDLSKTLNHLLDGKYYTFPMLALDNDFPNVEDVTHPIMRGYIHKLPYVAIKLIDEDNNAALVLLSQKDTALYREIKPTPLEWEQISYYEEDPIFFETLTGPDGTLFEAAKKGYDTLRTIIQNGEGLDMMGKKWRLATTTT